MKHRNITALLLPGMVLTSLISNAQSERPNIIVILADDAGYADFGFMGSQDIKTPNLDALSAQGRIFSDAHVAATVSSPSRAMLMTGRYGQRFGYECNTESAGQGLPETEQILPALLKSQGYNTACIGKWHLGSLDYQHPNTKGFDEFYGLIGGGRNYYYNENQSDKPDSDSKYLHNSEPTTFEGYFTDELTRRAKEVIAQSNDSPFMMYLSYTAPHSPNQAKAEDLELFEGEPRAVYAAMMWALDRGVGEVVAELEKSGKLDNTIIFFSSDNGGATTNNSSNLPLKGFKGNKFEGGQRIPFFAVWGDKWQGEVIDGLSSTLDIFATLVDVLDIPKKELANPIDGVSLLPWLEGKKQGNPHKELYWRKMDSKSIRYKDYKLIVTEGVDSALYHIGSDIAEYNNIIDSEPKIASKLLKKLENWEKECCIEPLWIENGWAPITNGYHQRLMNNEIKIAADLYKK